MPQLSTHHLRVSEKNIVCSSMQCLALIDIEAYLAHTLKVCPLERQSAESICSACKSQLVRQMQSGPPTHAGSAEDGHTATTVLQGSIYCSTDAL